MLPQKIYASWLSYSQFYYESSQGEWKTWAAFWANCKFIINFLENRNLAITFYYAHTLIIL